MSNRKRLYRVFVVAVTLFWVAMMWAMLRREVFLPRLPRPRLGASGSRLSFDALPIDTWMGIYFSDGRKVGYSHSQILPAGESSEDGYTVINETRLQLAFLKTSAEVRMDARAEIGGDGQFERFDIEVSSEGTSFKGEAEVVDGKTHFRVTTGGATRTFVRDAPPDGLVADSMSPLLVAANLRPGVTYRADLLDPISFTSSKAKVTLVGRERIDVGDEKVDADRILIEYQGVETIAWVVESGEVVQVDTGMGLSMVREPREMAQDMTQGGRRGRRGSADLARFAVVPSGKRIPDSADVSMMTVRIDGVPLKGLTVEDSSQRVMDRSTGTIEIASRVPASSRIRPFPMERLNRRMRRLTQPEMLIESDEPEMVARAESIVAGSTDSWQAALAIYDWVNQSVEKDIVFSVPSALEVLHNLRGDCNEHTTLFVGLARAAGIPARIQLGLVYSVVYGQGGFYYHAWPEVYVGEWVRMDPTLGQPVADGTHIMFVEGGISQWSEILPLVGSIRIEVLDVETGLDEKISVGRALERRTTIRDTDG